VRRTALGAVLTALLALLVPIGGTAAAATTDHQTASVCISTSHDDPQDIAQLDGRNYTLSFDCSTRVWTFDVLTTDQWVAHDLNRGDVFLDTDDDPSTGCKGADYAVEALGSNSGIFASVYRTPDCAHQSSVATASASHPAGDELKVTFDDSSVTSPRMFGWYADLVSSAGTDQLPDNSYWVECQPDIAGTRSMAHVHFVHDLPNDFNATRQWDLALVGAPAAWSVTHGSADVPVAVLDTGVDATHPDLAGKLLPGYDALHDQPLPAGDTDLEGHGTSTAGVVAAATDNGSGLASLGWNTKVMPVRVGRSCGEIDELAEIRGLHWAVDHGARVVNLSFGSPDSDSFEAAAISYAQSHGALVVASSGNESSSVPDYPAAYNGVFGVGAVGFNGLHASYSNVGSDVALVAPGGSADGNPAHDIAVLAEGGGTRSEAGTSFSSPEVAAAAALVLAVNPALTSGDVASLL
jgi:subtilisin family serine protease